MKRTISPEEYSDLRSSGEDHHSLDVRTIEEFAAGHIDVAVNLPVDRIEADIASVVPDKESLIIVNCRSGGRAGRCLSTFEEMGYTNVHALKGSYLDVK
jgi:phage shock protein E